MIDGIKHDKRKASQKKYYLQNKEACNGARTRRNYTNEFGKEFVDSLYEEHDNDTQKIKEIIKLHKAMRKLNALGVSNF